MAHRTEDLAEQLQQLGIQRGDAVLVRAGLSSLGKLEARHPGKGLLAALQQAVGSEGTILGLTFTKSFTDPEAHPDDVFTPKTRPITGGLARTLLAAKGAVRSRHPTNSWVAVGAEAEVMMAGHDHTATCFAPIRGLLERGGKMLLVGCVHDSPGFSTVHYAQDQLGLSTQNRIPPEGALYEDANGETKVFFRKDTPGCSTGFYRFYPAYEAAGQLRKGKVGDAESYAIDAEDAFQTEYVILKKNPRAALCKRPDCFHCRAALRYNKRDRPRWLLRRLIAKLGLNQRPPT